MADLRSRFQKVMNQGEIGSSSACAIVALAGYHLPELAGSPLFLYYNERSKEGTTKIDRGGSMREAVLSLINYGICEESSWPYLVSELAVRPPNRCYKEGLKY